VKTVTMMRSEIEALQKGNGDLKAQAIANNRDLEDFELELINKAIDQIEKITRAIATEERMQAIDAKIAEPTTVQVKPNPMPENRALITMDDSKERFSSFGEQMMAVVKAANPDRRSVDPRLNTRAASGLNETVPSEGGFLVQHDFATEILTEVFETGLLAPRCRTVNISGNANGTKMNGIDETSRVNGSRYGGVQAFWIGEADEKTATKPKFRQIELNLHKLIGLCYATDENLEDASQLEGVIKAAFINEFGFKIDDSIINGTGAGQPKGILTGGADLPCVEISKEVGQPADTLVWENISKMWARLFAPSRGNAVWLVNQNCEPQLQSMSVAVGTGGIPVYMPAGGYGGAAVAPFSTLMGRPVLPIEQCPTLGDAGDIILADLNGYMLARKAGIKQDMSIHVRFIYDESVFRFVLRVDGQPVLASSKTPYKGSDTLSHFVKIESRA